MASNPPFARLNRVFTRPRRDGVGLEGLSLDIARGEFLTLLGPGNAGTRAVLDLLAGFERPERGEILVEGRPVGRTPAHRRGVGVVLRGEGLFPALTVGANIAFPLRMHRISRRGRRERLAELLDMFGLTAFAKRRPAQLSKPQRLRAALARALAPAPKLLVMDEPLAGVDPDDRAALQIELRELRRQAGVTIVHATHDAVDAMAISDRIALMDSGSLLQLGTPDTLYDRPDDLAVAAAMGEINRLPGLIQSIEDDIAVVKLEGGLLVEGQLGALAHAGEHCLVCIRPERLAVANVAAAEMGEGAVPARVETVIYRGDHTRILLSIPGPGAAPGRTMITVRRPAGAALAGLEPGRSASIAWQPHHARVF